MSDVGNALKRRFSTLRIRVVVPELKEVIPDDSQGEPAVYASPFTLDDSRRLQKYIDSDSPEGFAHVVCIKAENEEGDRLFDIGDKAVLMQCCEAHIISRLGQSLMASVSIEDARGNSSATRKPSPSSGSRTSSAKRSRKSKRSPTMNSSTGSPI